MKKVESGTCTMPGRRTGYFLIALLAVSLTTNGQIDQNSQLFKEYVRLNNTESKLEEYKDNDSELLLKLNQLEVINRSRSSFKAPPVKLDILASRVANKMSSEAARGGYISHWNERGEKPYHRYAFAGGVDHITENASGESFSGSYIVDDNTKSAMMNRFHNDFMSERAPADGHKKNIIDPVHNYVGIGLYLDKNEFRYYEEFIDRYLIKIDAPTEVRKGEQFSIEIEIKQGTFVSYISAHYEKNLVKKSISWLKNSGSYQDYSEVIEYEIGPWDIAAFREGSAYTLPVKFSKTGLYYIHIYLDNREYTGGGSFTTEGKIQASGLVIRVL